MVNVAVYPAILSCSRSQIVKIIANRQKNDAISNNAKIHKKLLIYLKVTEDSVY